MTIDATFWVMISFFIFIGLLVYFKIPQKIKTTLEENINILEINSRKKKNKKTAKTERIIFFLKLGFLFFIN